MRVKEMSRVSREREPLSSSGARRAEAEGKIHLKADSRVEVTVR